jgi:hypothetical protein
MSNELVSRVSETLTLMKGVQEDLNKHTETLGTLETAVAVLAERIPKQPCSDHINLEKRVDKIEEDAKEKDKRTTGWMVAALFAIASAVGNIILGLMKQGASNG